MPTPEWFFGLMMPQVGPIVIGFIVASAVLEMAVKTLRVAARRAIAGPRRRNY